MAQVAGFAWIRLDINDFPTRHPYGLALSQNRVERILADWVGELEVPIHCGREVEGIAQDETGVDIDLAGGQRLRAKYLVGPAKAAEIETWLGQVAETYNVLSMDARTFRVCAR